METLGSVGTPDDLEDPDAVAGQRRLKLLAGVVAVGEEMAQPREAVVGGGENGRGALTVLDVRRV